MRVMIFGGMMLAALVSCDGPNQQAGERQDKAAANQAGEDYRGSGPAERVGRAQDRADRAAGEAREASQAAVEAESDNYRRQAEVEATRLEEQARAVRETAKARAEALEQNSAEPGGQ